MKPEFDLNLPAEFGKGWMSTEARDLFRIAVYFAGVDPIQLLKAMPRGRGSKANVRSVESALMRLRSRDTA